MFFKSRGKARELAQWYAEHLGFDLEEWGGAQLEWKKDTSDDGGITVWHVADADTEWFAPSDSPFMFNYRVDDLIELVAQLKAKGVALHKEIESHENGKFAWIVDPEGNKIELWEPKAWDPANKDA